MYKLSHGWLAYFTQVCVQHPDLEGQRVVTTCILLRPFKSTPKSGSTIWNPHDEYNEKKAKTTAFFRALDAMLPYSACRSANDVRAFRNARRSLWESLLKELNK